MRLDRVLAGVAGILGLAGLGALALRRRAPGSGDAVSSPLKESVQVLTGLRVLNRDLAARDGVRPEVLWVLDEWERVGTHVIEIRSREKFPYFPSGSVRWTDEEQADAARKGLSGAVKPNDSAHGPRRRAGLDVHPIGFNPNRSFAQQPPEMFAQVRTFALWVEGLVHPNGTRYRTGRLWSHIVAPDGVTGDWVHYEILGWEKLPLLSETKGGTA